MSYRPTRQSFTAQQRRAALQRQPFCAWGCGRPSIVVDHIVPDAEGGKTTLANAQGMCRTCHDEKTRAEITRGRGRSARARPTRPHPGLVARSDATAHDNDSAHNRG